MPENKTLAEIEANESLALSLTRRGQIHLFGNEDGSKGGKQPFGSYDDIETAALEAMKAHKAGAAMYPEDLTIWIKDNRNNTVAYVSHDGLHVTDTIDSEALRGFSVQHGIQIVE